MLKEYQIQSPGDRNVFGVFKKQHGNQCDYRERGIGSIVKEKSETT